MLAEKLGKALFPVSSEKANPRPSNGVVIDVWDAAPLRKPPDSISHLQLSFR